MIKLFKDIWRGAGYLEGYGHHPGTGIMLAMILLCGLAGSSGGWRGFLGGSVLGAIGLSIPWIIGCRARARAYDRDVERTVEILGKDFK
jgi:hypothetical protein